MRITVGVTDNAWAGFLAARDHLTEANFWVPSARNFTGRASDGEPFLFKTKAPRNALTGGGFLEGFMELRVSEAWAVFGEGNGVASEDDLRTAIWRYQDRNGAARAPDPTIGCIILRNLFFAPPGDELPPPEGWRPNIVQGKTFDPADRDFAYVNHAFLAFQGGARVDYVWDRDLGGVDLDRERYGAPVLTRPRLGQGGFRLRVLDAYQRRCAITGSKIAPALEAAHIRPYARGGEHVVSNGLTLRSDVHTLYDAGYLGIGTDLRIHVSERLRTDFGNGEEFYERQRRGDMIEVPRRPEDGPDRTALEWHMDTRFIAA